MHLCEDGYGNEYLFKPAVRKGTDEYEPFRADIQVAAAKLQQIVSPETAVKCELAEVGDMKGAIQEKVKVDEEKTAAISAYYYDGVPLDENIARQFMREYVVDFCLANYDAHYNNFIVDDKGNLRGVDKEQSLKHLTDYLAQRDYKMDNYHPNERFGEERPIYGRIFKDVQDGVLPASILQEVHKGIEAVRTIPANEYLEIFTPYAKSLGYEGEKMGEFYEQILNRRDSLKEVERMLEEMGQPRSQQGLVQATQEQLKTVGKPSLTELSQYLGILKEKFAGMVRGHEKVVENEK